MGSSFDRLKIFGGRGIFRGSLCKNTAAPAPAAMHVAFGSTGQIVDTPYTK